MSDNTPDPSDGPLQRSDSARYMTYAKWGLMGVGGLVIAKVALSILFNPLVLVAGAGAGGAGWWLWRRSKSTPSDAAEPTAEDRKAAVARTSADAEAEAELTALLSAEAPSAPSAPVVAPTPKRDEAAAHAERLRVLEEMKAQIGRE